MTSSGKAIFLARPRRFGKSLLCSTLAAIYEGRRDLFDGLAIDKSDYDWKKHPVVRIDLNCGEYLRGINYLDSIIHLCLERCAEKYGLLLEGKSSTEKFTRLLSRLYLKYNERVIVIIDEYDKPLLITMENPELQAQMRSSLKPFFGVMKSCDEYLKKAFLTGVTKFSKVAIFSDLNNLVDISLKPQFADICGITQKEMETNFANEITNFAKQNDLTREAYLDQLKYFYNGYRFTENPLTIYNPFGLMNHFYREGKFGKWWYESATPTFIVDLIKAQKIDPIGLEAKEIGSYEFGEFDIQGMETLPTMYQSGYLTIVDYNATTKTFTLGYPNSEVRSAFSNDLLEHSPLGDKELYSSLAMKMPTFLEQGNIDDAMKILQSFLASIPYDIQPEQERYYQTAVHLIFNFLGSRCRSEVRTSDGRIDSVVETKNYVYCFEFKLDGTPDEALQQINSKEYTLQWNSSDKKVYKVGVTFDSKKRNIGEWKIETE
jgi:hypothetical protein